MRAVHKGTVSRWKATCDILDAIDGKVAISQLEHFQPSHALEIARAFRRKGKRWAAETKDRIAEWIERCEVAEWTVQQLRQKLLEADIPTDAPSRPGVVTDLGELISAGRTFRTLYCDPPWRYANQGTRASTDRHYRTLTVAEIAALPVGKLAANAAQLHLWCTNAFLQDAFEMLKAWGFEYKSILVWVKPELG
jgi:hypothetical protein